MILNVGIILVNKCLLLNYLVRNRMSACVRVSACMYVHARYDSSKCIVTS